MKLELLHKEKIKGVSEESSEEKIGPKREELTGT
jgi:hypothetical protein